jgi:FkbM family methyltransferase
MTLTRLNPWTRFPQAVRSLLADRRAQYVLMDIGARDDGSSCFWTPLASMTDFIGFEPEPEECARLNEEFQRNGLTRSRVYPKALAGRTGMHPFYVTQHPFSSSLHRGNEAWLDRFPFTTLKVTREIEVETATLDQFCAETALDHVDFIKVDVEGAEYDVLDGARRMLRAQRVLGIFTEFWWDPVIKGQKAFADIDTLLRDHGFRFFDLDLHRYCRATLPAARLQQELDGSGRRVVKVRIDGGYGQAWTGDALYFRDPVGELKAGSLDPGWDREMLLRLCGLLDCFDYGDCALEVLETFRTTLLAGIDVDLLMDALVPELGRETVPYDSYRSLSIDVRQKFNLRAYGLTDWKPPATGYRSRD